MKLIMDKRGVEIPVVLVVLLTIAIISYTLFTFIRNNGGVSGEVIQPRFFENIYVEESRVRVYLAENIFSAMEASYSELKDKTKIDSNQFKIGFISKLKENLKTQNPDDSNLVNLKNYILNENFVVDFNGNILTFTLKDFSLEVKDESKGILISYKPDISFKIAINEL